MADFPAQGQTPWGPQLKQYVDDADGAKITNAKGVTAIWTGTQAQYTALTNKSATTLYVIV